MENEKIIFHISGNHYDKNFEHTHTFKIWQELAKGFDEYHIFAHNKNFEFYHGQKDNIHVHLIPSINRRMFLFFFSSWLLPLYIAKYKPTHMLAQCPVMGGLAATFVSSVFKIPFMVELHGQHYFKAARTGLLGRLEHQFYKKLSPITFARAKKIRILSDHMYQEFSHVYGNQFDNKLTMIPVRVDFSKFSRKSNYNIGEPIKLVNVGRLSRNKNQLGLLKDLSQAEAKIQVTLIGDGDEKEEIDNLVQELPKNLSVTLTGNIDHHQISKILEESDIFVHYANSEGTPRAIIEAMAVGLPVIVKEAGFMNDILIDGVNSIVLNKTGNAESLFNAIKTIISSENFRQQIGNLAHKMVIDKFEWNRCFELYRNELLGLTN